MQFDKIPDACRTLLVMPCLLSSPERAEEMCSQLETLGCLVKDKNISFLLLGLPLAIRTSRRETSVGLFLSVILAGSFFMAIVMCEVLTNLPKIYPQYLLWLPNILFQTVGAYMTCRISRK